MTIAPFFLFELIRSSDGPQSLVSHMASGRSQKQESSLALTLKVRVSPVLGLSVVANSCPCLADVLLETELATAAVNDGSEG